MLDFWLHKFFQFSIDIFTSKRGHHVKKKMKYVKKFYCFSSQLKIVLPPLLKIIYIYNESNQKDVWTTKLWLKYQTHVKNLVSAGFYGMVHCPMYIYMYVDFAIKSSTKTNEIYLIIICNSNEITCQNYSPAKKIVKKNLHNFVRIPTLGMVF